jgi:elongation factor G
MKVYVGSDIRNVAIVGHAHSGKTELITAILKTAKSPAASSRENGGAVTQYDEEEIARKMTMSNAAAFAEWDGIKANMIDTPGFHMFLHEARGAMLPAETAIVVINAQTGVESGTERVWNYAAEIGLRRTRARDEWRCWKGFAGGGDVRLCRCNCRSWMTRDFMASSTW